MEIEAPLKKRDALHSTKIACVSVSLFHLLKAITIRVDDAIGSNFGEGIVLNGLIVAKIYNFRFC